VKLVTFVVNGSESLGIWSEPRGILDLAAAAQSLLGRALPADMLSFIAAGPAALKSAREVLDAATKSPQAKWLAIDSVKLAAPIPHPRKNVFCVGRNYKAHIIEGARARNREVVFPPVPEFFSKPPTAVIGHDDEVHLDTRYTRQLDYEIELAIVIGKRCRDLSADAAMGAIFGYTIVNDVSAREVQQAHGQWFKGKGFDTYCPMGPCIVTADEYGNPSGRRRNRRAPLHPYRGYQAVRHQIRVRMNDGTLRTTYQSSAPAFSVGKKVKVVNGQVVSLG